MHHMKRFHWMAVLFAALGTAGAALANPTGVPIDEEAPLSCQTSAFNVEAVVGTDGEFPKAATCGGEACAEYHYRISSSTYSCDHIVFAVLATQDLYSTSPAATVSLPGKGDSATGFLKYVDHEYAVRFNSHSSKAVEAKIYVKGASKARAGTVLVRSGLKKTESCLIASPGITEAADPFQPVTASQSVVAAGGKCVAELIFDQRGRVKDIVTNTPGCFVGSPEDGIVRVNGEPLRNNTGPDGITFGDNTTTCYGPPIPSIPRCICTRAPCP